VADGPPTPEQPPLGTLSAKPFEEREKEEKVAVVTVVAVDSQTADGNKARAIGNLAYDGE
jgi:hypothetical protein